MGIKDLLGAGKAIEKLIDVVSKGTGRVFKSYFDKKDIETRKHEIVELAEAQAKAIGILSAATKQNQIGTGNIEYSDSNIKITSSSENIAFSEYSLPETNLNDRIALRNTYQELKRQLNIENVTAIAAEELKEEKEVSDESVNEDWINRFFNIVQDVSDEEMQTLWGKILAGEIKQPDSYSLRTLELLKNLSKDEAEIFIKISRLAFAFGQAYVIFKGEDEKLYQEFEIDYSELMLMFELGLIDGSPFLRYTFDLTQEIDYKLFVFGDHGVLITIEPNTPQFSIPIFAFTKMGTELLKLTSRKTPTSYIYKFKEFLEDKKLGVKYLDLSGISINELEVSQFYEFPATL